MGRIGPVKTLEAAKAIEKDIIEIRRAIHMHPEIGLETPVTSGLVARTLRELGIEVRERVGGHGVVGLLRGEGPDGSDAGRTIALRADIDALPVTEDTGVEYRSKIPGAMHACGHDAHAAILLGAAKVLAGMRKEFSGNVKFIFQPAEEGPGGAQPMIRDGCLDNPKPDAIIGAHVGNLWPVTFGQIGVKAGPLMAATDSCAVTVRGKGGHGATPHKTVDPVVIASYIIPVLQTVVSREIDPLESAVVTVGKIEAGTAANIIPETCQFNATVRYLDRSLGRYIEERIDGICSGIARALRGEATVEYHHGYPPVVNDPKVSELVAKAAAAIVGEENVRDIPAVMGGEDMSYYLQEIPGAFFAIGTGMPGKGTDFPHHHPKFNIDEKMLHVGAAVFAQACLDFLAK